MQLERSRFEETVGAMSEQLMDFVEKMNKLERECVSKKILKYPDLMTDTPKIKLHIFWSASGMSG